MLPRANEQGGCTAARAFALIMKLREREGGWKRSSSRSRTLEFTSFGFRKLCTFTVAAAAAGVHCGWACWLWWLSDDMPKYTLGSTELTHQRRSNRSATLCTALQSSSAEDSINHHIFFVFHSCFRPLLCTGIRYNILLLLLHCTISNTCHPATPLFLGHPRE